MKYTPGAVQSVDLDIAVAPYLGGEFACFMTQKPAVLLGEIDLSAAGIGTWVKSQAAVLTAPADMQAVLLTPVRSAAALTVALACMDTTAIPVAMDGTATFTPPARATNQTFNFQRGFAVDFAPKTAGKQFSAITGMAAVAPVVGGGPNQVVRVYQLPELVDYELIEGTVDIKFNTKARVAKGIDDRLETDKWVKRGKSKPGELSIGSKFKSFAEGMTRYDGQKCTCMLVGIKDGQVTGDRLVFTGYVPTIDPDLPEGEGEAVTPASGKFTDHLFFVAPGPDA